MPSQRVIVLKFGGSVLDSADRMPIAVHEIYRWRRAGWCVVAVVSALRGRTDALHAQCDGLSGRAAAGARAAMASAGEHESAALLGLHLDRAGVSAGVLTPGAIRLRAAGTALDAEPVSVDAASLARVLDEDGVAVVPGYTGIDASGRTVVFGRGGSDLTALFLAHALGAERCRLVKDVDGLYEFDPADVRVRPRRFVRASFADALATDGSIVQPKAVRYACSIGLAFELGRINGTRPTRIGPVSSVLGGEPDLPCARSVAVLGAGTVGGGVLQLVTQLPDHFRVEGVAVRHPERSADLGMDPCCVWRDATALAAQGCDVVVEAMGGIEPANAAIRVALAAGSDVVTANKAVMAEHGATLLALAGGLGRRLTFSAAVGGGMPAVERVGASPVRRIRGVLNGTANFVLDAITGGVGLDEAITEAQRLGFAEADPSRDVDGRDSLDKLLVLAQTLGRPASAIRATAQREPIPATLEPVRGNTRPRQVAELDAGGASIRLTYVADDDPLFGVPGEWNALDITRCDGTRELIRGRGAGRWPTAESVLADLLEVAGGRLAAAGSTLEARAVASGAHDHGGRGAPAWHAVP